MSNTLCDQLPHDEPCNATSTLDSCIGFAIILILFCTATIPAPYNTIGLVSTTVEAEGFSMTENFTTAGFRAAVIMVES